MKKNTIMAIALLVLIAFGGTILIYPMMFNSVNDSAPASIPEPAVPPTTPPQPKMNQ